MTEEYQELLERVYTLAYENEAKYGACPQAVLAALQEYFDGIDDATIQAVHSFAGGGALSGDGTCGALVGGMAAISSQFGRQRSEFGKKTASRLRNFSATKELQDKFVEEFGGVICKDVQKSIIGRSFNLWDKEDYKKFEEAGGHDDKCTSVSGKTARWTAEILIEKGVRPKG